MTQLHSPSTAATAVRLSPDQRTDPSAAPVVPARGSHRGAGIGEVVLADGFWHRLQQTNATATLQHCLQWMERLGWLANFDRVADGTTGPDRPGWQFSDSEIYKLVEALAWDHGRTRDPTTDRLVRELTDRLAAAQDPDGYLNTCFGHAGQPGRYTDLEEGHELYCTGHLLQAAVARQRTSGADRLVQVARRAADQVCAEFGPQGRQDVCGHPEIELGLIELGRALDEPRYVEQARLFVERRGHRTLTPRPLLSAAYWQDDVPVRDADVWRGHAVRALYLTAAAVDVAVDCGDDELLAAVERQWTRSVERRTYLTGGMGSRHQDEGFGDDWELPADRAYCETCAGVASCMVSWRLHLATGDVRYADLMERTFYNVLATSPRSDGRAFFYANPLQQRVPGADVLQDVENRRAEGGARAPWFEVSCCPTNVARTLASWQAFTASVDGDVVTLAQYAAGDVRVELDGGGVVALRVHTAYPLDGEVALEVLDAPDRPVTLRLRVPHWAAGARLEEPARTREVPTGWADVHGRRTPGERLLLQLPVHARLTWPDPRIDAVRGCVAVERGPLVLCLESTDLPDDVALDAVRVDASAPVTDTGTGAVLQGSAVSLAASGLAGGDVPPYGADRPDPRPADQDRGRIDLHFGPYHQWAEREASTMRVWVPAP